MLPAVAASADKAGGRSFGARRDFPQSGEVEEFGDLGLGDGDEEEKDPEDDPFFPILADVGGLLGVMHVERGFFEVVRQELLSCPPRNGRAFYR